MTFTTFKNPTSGDVIRMRNAAITAREKELAGKRLSSKKIGDSSSHTYVYSATVKKVIDGDTIAVDISIGFNLYIHGERIRLARINAPELRWPERDKGLESKRWLREEIEGKEILIHTFKHKRGKYGRYIAEVYLDGVNINDKLVSLGLAKYKEY